MMLIQMILFAGAFSARQRRHKMNKYGLIYNILILVTVLSLSITGFIFLGTAEGLYSLVLLVFSSTDRQLFNLEINLSDEDKKDGDLSK